MVRYADGPTVRVETHVAAPPDVVWPLVTDIRLPARFSTELTGAAWAQGCLAGIKELAEQAQAGG